MRKVIFILCAIVSIYLLAFGQTPENGDRSRSIPEGTLTVKLNKSEYVLLEPIVARFSFRLPSAEVIGDLSRSTSIKLSYGGGTKEFNGLRHHVIIKDPIALPQGTPPSLLPKDASPSSDAGEQVKEEVIDRVDEFFPQPGFYQLQFFVHTNAGNTVASNVIDVAVLEPTGTDKAAYEILRSFEKPMTFYWVWEVRDGLKRLQEFANTYRDTVYGEYAILHLGEAYLAKGEFAKAEVEFKKIRSSKNTHLAKIADRSIDGIRKQKLGIDSPD